MQPDVVALQISNRELERLSGCEVSSIFIGGVLGGVIRASVFRQPQRLLALGLTELLVTVFIFMLTLPIGLLVIRNVPGSVNDTAGISHFLQVTGGCTIATMLGWHGFMLYQFKRLKPLMYLLDEIDRYHEVLATVEVLDRLWAIEVTQNGQQRHDLLEALHLIRDNLIAGLMAERILRQSWGKLSQQTEILLAMESNLTMLRSLELNQTAREYGQLLETALQIGVDVHQEMQQLSRLPLQR
jgi:hypothetical protein